MPSPVSQRRLPSRRLRRRSSPPATWRPSRRVKRNSASCSQYQSEERSVSERKRASPSRIARSASARCRNWPIWPAITPSACMRRLSGSRIRRQVKESTATTRPAERTGTSRAAARPVRRESPLRTTRGSPVESASHSGSPDCHTEPTSPAPGSNTSPREPWTKSAASATPGMAQYARRRICMPGASSFQNSAQSQFSVTQIARSAARSASGTPRTSARKRVTRCSRRSSCSARFWRVISRPMPR